MALGVFLLVLAVVNVVVVQGGGPSVLAGVKAASTAKAAASTAKAAASTAKPAVIPPRVCASFNSSCIAATDTQTYVDMGCTRGSTTYPDCCPNSYDCSNIAKRSKTQCQYQGKLYSPNVKITDDFGIPCVTNITCKIVNSIPQFSYSPVQCPAVTFNATTTLQTWTQGKCCATGTRSTTLQPSEFTCSYQGYLFPVGSVIPSFTDPCLYCICAQGFTGAMVAPYCKKIVCGTELDYTNTILKGMAPVYDEGSCCPIGWQAPNPKNMYLMTAASRVPPNTPVDPQSVNATCTFGTIKMKLEDVVFVATPPNKPCAQCVCVVAPTPVCSMIPDCTALVAQLKADKTIIQY